MSGWYQALYYPPVNQSTWVGGTLHYDLNYMVTYWLNGNVPLAALLRAAKLVPEHDLSAITDSYLDYILAAQANTTTGKLGPDACGGQFSKMLAVRALLLELAGYDVKVFEFIGGEHTAKNVLIAATRRAAPRSAAEDAETRRQLREQYALFGLRTQRLASHRFRSAQAAAKVNVMGIGMGRHPPFRSAAL